MFYFLLYLVIFLITSVVFLIIYLLRRRNKIIPIDDIGLVFSVFIALYTILPIISWLLQGGRYILPIGRLYSLQPTVYEVLELSLIGLCYILGVLSIYLYSVKGLGILQRSPILIHPSLWVSNKLMFISAFMYIAGFTTLLLIRYKYNVYEAQSYNETYIAYLNIPKNIAQVLNVLKGLVSMFYLVFLTGLFMRWSNKRSRILIVFLFLFPFIMFEVGYSRAYLFQTIILFTLLFHLFVTPIKSLKIIFASGMVLLVVFLLLGIRGSGAISEQFIMPLGEFDVIWGNAVQMLREKNQEILSVPFYVYLYEFVAFIPSNILPFTKASHSSWLMDTYYPVAKAEGGGLMFGAIAQSVIGFGMVEAFIRGIIIGFVSLKFKSWLRIYKYSWRILILYLILYLSIPSMARGSTLAPLFLIIGSPLVALFLLSMLEKILPSKGNIQKIIK